METEWPDPGSILDELRARTAAGFPWTTENQERIKSLIADIDSFIFRSARAHLENCLESNPG